MGSRDYKKASTAGMGWARGEGAGKFRETQRQGTGVVGPPGGSRKTAAVALNGSKSKGVLGADLVGSCVGFKCMRRKSRRIS